MLYGTTDEGVFDSMSTGKTIVNSVVSAIISSAVAAVAPEAYRDVRDYSKRLWKKAKARRAEAAALEEAKRTNPTEGASAEDTPSDKPLRTIATVDFSDDEPEEDRALRFLKNRLKKAPST